jgi:hypothetical protein
LLARQQSAELFVDVLLKIRFRLLLFGRQFESFNDRGRHDLARLRSAAKASAAEAPAKATSARSATPSRTTRTTVRWTHAAAALISVAGVVGNHFGCPSG